MARKFKCRNGTILEEKITDLGDDYICLYDPTGKFSKGEHVSLIPGERLSRRYSIGGALGEEYDIVEELFPKNKRKIPVATNAVLHESSIQDDPPKWYRVYKEYQKRSKGIVLKYEQYPNATEGDFHTTDRFYLNRDKTKLSKEEKADLVVKLSQFLELPFSITTALDCGDYQTTEIVIKC